MYLHMFNKHNKSEFLSISRIPRQWLPDTSNTKESPLKFAKRSGNRAVCTFTVRRTISNKCHAHNETDNVSTVDQRFWRKMPFSGSVKILIPLWLSNMLITSRASRRVSAISRSNNEDRASRHRRIKGHGFTSPRMTSASLFLFLSAVWLW